MQRFSDSLMVIDLDNFLINKQQINGSYDVIIEMVALRDDKTEECVLASFCNLFEDRGENNKIIYKLKVDSQKLNVSVNCLKLCLG